MASSRFLKEWLVVCQIIRAVSAILWMEEAEVQIDHRDSHRIAKCGNGKVRISIPITSFFPQITPCWKARVMVAFIDQLDGLRDAWIAGKTSFLGMSVKSLSEENSIWINRPSKEPLLVGTIHSVESLNRTKRHKEDENLSLSFWAEMSTSSCPWTLGFLVLRLSDSRI